MTSLLFLGNVIGLVCAMLCRLEENERRAYVFIIAILNFGAFASYVPMKWMRAAETAFGFLAVTFLFLCCAILALLQLKLSIRQPSLANWAKCAVVTAGTAFFAMVLFLGH